MSASPYQQTFKKGDSFSVNADLRQAWVKCFSFGTAELLNSISCRKRLASTTICLYVQIQEKPMQMIFNWSLGLSLQIDFYCLFLQNRNTSKQLRDISPLVFLLRFWFPIPNYDLGWEDFHIPVGQKNSFSLPILVLCNHWRLEKLFDEAHYKEWVYTVNLVLIKWR